MKSAKDWGWREFITLQALFDADAGYLVNDDCVFAAEVLMLKESSEAHQVCMLRHSKSEKMLFFELLQAACTLVPKASCLESASRVVDCCKCQGCRGKYPGINLRMKAF